jgi:broad specificity phosphatase PhoE
LRNEPLAAVYGSSLGRCQETARVVAEPHDLVPIPCDAFVEVDYGNWDGMLRRDIVIQYPERYAAWVRDPASVPPPGGESGYGVLARAVPALNQIVKNHTNESVLVVAHKAVNRLLFCDVLGLPPRLYRARIGQLPCALNCIEWHEGGPMVTLLNDTAHHAVDWPRGGQGAAH